MSYPDITPADELKHMRERMRTADETTLCEWLTIALDDINVLMKENERLRAQVESLEDELRERKEQP